MINYTEKGDWFHEAVAEAGYSIEQRGDGNFYSSDDIAVQAIMDSFDPLPFAKAESLKEIAEYANSLINKNINPLKQKRLNADAISASIGKGKGLISPAEQIKLDNYEASYIYPNKVFAQYDIDEILILSVLDWTLIAALTKSAVTNLDAVS